MLGDGESGAPTSLTYTKSGCPTCVWYEEKIKESIHGQWLNHESSLSNQRCTYDKVGRLTLVKDTPVAKGCTTRAYTYDADSNRLSMTTRAPNEKGDCMTSGGGTVQSSSYDGADRITTAGFTYDPFGRQTTVPSSHSGGGQLSMTYYTNDMVRTETQDGKTVGWLLDPTQGRQRATIAEGTKQDVMHYADGSDSPVWVAHMTSGVVTSWDRNAGALDGGLGAIVSYDGIKTTVELQMSNLHGDIIGTASPEAGASGPLKTFEATEFGVPRETSNRKYGWLGGKQRATTLPSGVTQMGVRAYVPGMGRFTSVDPIYGGSANSYEYAMQDPIGMFDLDGKIVLSPYATCVPDSDLYPQSYLRGTQICWKRKVYIIRSMYQINIAAYLGFANCVSTWITLKFGHPYKSAAIMAVLIPWCVKHRWGYVRWWSWWEYR